MTPKFCVNSDHSSGLESYTLKMVMTDEEVFIGSAEVMLKNKGRYWTLISINIEEPFRREGHATCLLNYLRNDLWFRNSIPIRVHPAGTEDKWLRDWYLKQGFREEKPPSAYLVCEPVDTHTESRGNEN
jgi:hypothetical protein